MGDASWSGRSVLVTGAAGYVGSALVERLVRAGCRVRRLGRQLPPAPGPGCEDVTADIREVDWAPLTSGMDTIFHLAAQTSAYRSEEDPLADLEINVRPALALLEACRRHGHRPVVVLAGAATQAGITDAGTVVDEARPLQPATIYDIDKGVAEAYLAHYVSRGWVRGSALRLANVYGPGSHSSAPDRNVLNRMVMRALAGEAVTVYGDGQFLRDYVFIDDVLTAFLAAGLGPAAADGRGLYLCSGRSTTLAQAFGTVAATVARLTGRPVELKHLDWPTGMLDIERRSFVADSGAIQRCLGWKPRTTLADGIEATVRYFLEGHGGHD